MLDEDNPVTVGIDAFSLGMVVSELLCGVAVGQDAGFLVRSPRDLYALTADHRAEIESKLLPEAPGSLVNLSAQLTDDCAGNRPTMDGVVDWATAFADQFIRDEGVSPEDIREVAAFLTVREHTNSPLCDMRRLL
jgi:hypothetical protein